MKKKFLKRVLTTLLVGFSVTAFATGGSDGDNGTGKDYDEEVEECSWYELCYWF